MRKISYLLIVAMMLLGVYACGDDGDDNIVEEPANNDTTSVKPDTPDTPDVPDTPSNVPAFAYGCDPSWITPMEAEGIKFYDKDGKQTECFALLKSVGFNAARFRVWVNPASSGSNGMCDIEDVVTKSKRAAALGYAIMIDFHYSDVWADPANQKKPKAWESIATVDELAKKVYDYTKESLQRLKNEGIDVAWVQIGNETQTGMMKTNSDGSETDINGAMSKDNTNFAKMVTQGTKAVKEVFPGAKSIVHLANGQSWDKLSWALNIMKAGNADYDILGVSLYPDFNNKSWYVSYIDACINNLNKVAESYNKDVMICEIGTSYITSWDGKRAITNTVIRAKNEVPRCKGVFYWEPQCYSAYNGYGMGGFLANGSPAPALDVFSGKVTELLPADDPNPEVIEGDVLILMDKSSGEQFGIAEKQDDGTYKATVTVTSNWYNFRVKDNDGNTYGVSDWNSQYSFVKGSKNDNFWFGNESGTFEVTFDIENQKWSYIVKSKN